MTRTWAGIFFYSCGTFCVQWVFWGHLETSGVWGQSWEAHGSAPCFSPCSVCWTTFGYFRGISGFGVADGHDPRCLLCSPLLTCLLWLWRPPNVAPGFASQFLPGHQQAGRSRENWRRNPSRPIIRRDFEGNPKRLRVPNWTEKRTKGDRDTPKEASPSSSLFRTLKM